MSVFKNKYSMRCGARHHSLLDLYRLPISTGLVVRVKTLTCTNVHGGTEILKGSFGVQVDPYGNLKGRACAGTLVSPADQAKVDSVAGQHIEQVLWHPMDIIK